MDEKLNKIGRSLNLSRVLQPTNLLEQLDIFIDRGGQYNPQFTYNWPSNNRLDTIYDSLTVLQEKRFGEKKIFQSEFAHIFKEKLDELFVKHGLILAYKKQDYHDIYTRGVELFGDLDSDLLTSAKQIIFSHKNNEQDLGQVLTSGEVRARIHKKLREYGIPAVHIEYDAEMSAKMSVKR